MEMPPERGKVQKKIRRSLVVLYRELTFSGGVGAMATNQNGSVSVPI